MNKRLKKLFGHELTIKWMYIFKKDGEYHIEGHASKIMFFNSKEEIDIFVEAVKKAQMMLS